MHLILSKYRAFIIIAVVIIIIIAIIYFKGRRDGKKYVPEMVKLPVDTNTSSTFNPGPYTDALKNDLYGYGLRNAKPYQDLLTLSNTQFVAVYNDWNKRYFSKWKETLPQAIKAEWPSWNHSWASAASAVLERFQTLSLG